MRIFPAALSVFNILATHEPNGLSRLMDPLPVRLLNRTRLLYHMGAFGWLGCAAFGSEGAIDQPLFDAEEPLAFRLEAPIHTLVRTRKEEPVSMDGRLVLANDDGTETVLDLSVRTRGNFRRLSTACDFPPLSINLKRSQVKGTVFENQNKLKVVTHCQDRGSSHHKFLYREFLVYKTYSHLTDASFRVRLAEIEFVDLDGKRKNRTHPAFLIEHATNVGRRIGGEKMKDLSIPPDLYDPFALARAELFQYMIANTDFTYFAGPDECCHNAKAFIPENGKLGIIPVPYDFDLSGLVNAPYAKPGPTFDLKRVTQRLYRGTRPAPEVFQSTIDLSKRRR